MMTPKAANTVLLTLAQAEAKRDRSLSFNPSAPWSFCPVCGTGQMQDVGYTFAAVDGRDPVTKAEGLMMIFYIDHPSIKRRCLWGFAGTPANGPAAEQLLLHGEALQVLALEEKMSGRAQ